MAEQRGREAGTAHFVVRKVFRADFVLRLDAVGARAAGKLRKHVAHARVVPTADHEAIVRH